MRVAATPMRVAAAPMRALAIETERVARRARDTPASRQFARCADI
jgi:hypothetical protein